MTPPAHPAIILAMPTSLDAVAKEALDAERSRYADAVARLTADDGPAAAAELERHFARVDEIMLAWAARVRNRKGEKDIIRTRGGRLPSDLNGRLSRRTASV